jgi:CRISPR type II-A-associated protein Csn2
MKLTYPWLHTVLEWGDTKVQGLVIENPGLLYRFLCDLQGQIHGLDGEIVLSEKETPVPISKRVEFLTDFIGWDGNNRKIATKLVGILEKASADDPFLQERNAILSRLEQYVYELADSQDLSVDVDNLSMAALLKAMGLRIDMGYESLGDRLFSYMDFISRCEGDKLFVLYALRPVLSADELSLFLETTLRHGMRILLVDAVSYPLLPLENRVTIDSDLCVI